MDTSIEVRDRINFQNTNVDTCLQPVIETLQKQSDENKYLKKEQIVTEIFGSNPEIKTFDDMRYIIEQNRSEAYNKGLKTGKEVIFGNIYKYIVKEFQ